MHTIYMVVHLYHGPPYTYQMSFLPDMYACFDWLFNFKIWSSWYVVGLLTYILGRIDITVMVSNFHQLHKPEFIRKTKYV